MKTTVSRSDRTRGRISTTRPPLRNLDSPIRALWEPKPGGQKPVMKARIKGIVSIASYYTRN